MANELIKPEENALIQSDESAFMIADLTTARQSFCTFNPQTMEGKAVMFRGMNNPDFRLSDKVNEVINVKDIYCEIVTLISQQTGEVTDCPRIVLFDMDGKSYQAVSMGIYNAVKKAIQVFGVPTWENGLPIKVRQINKNERKILTFDIQI